MPQVAGGFPVHDEVSICEQALAQFKLPPVNPNELQVKPLKSGSSQASPPSLIVFPQTGGTVQSTGQLAFVSVGGSQMLFPQTGGVDGQSDTHVAEFSAPLQTPSLLHRKLAEEQQIRFG